MSIRNLIRTTVLKTNSIFPFNFLNRIPYHIALKVFILIFSSYSEIKSIYLRHGMSKKNWVPAISDIDITVIIDGHLSFEEEFNLLKLLWDKFDRLKKIFPMLGEVDILNEKEIEKWSGFTIRGYETSKWKLLYGKEVIKSSYVNETNILAIDSLNFALTNYLEYYLPKFYSEDSSGYLSQKELTRLAFKILRYADVPFDESRNKAANKIESFIISYTIDFIILKDDLSPADMIVLLDAIRNSFKSEPRKPVILPFKIFEYMLRIYNPFFYSQLHDQRKVLSGKDSFNKITQPDFCFYRKTLADDVGNIFLLQRNKSLIQDKTVRQFIGNEFKSIVNRTLFLKLYLGKAILEPMFNDSLDECRKNYPGQIQKMDFILNNCKSLDGENLSKDAFMLLRTLTGDIYNSLVSSEVPVN